LKRIDIYPANRTTDRVAAKTIERLYPTANKKAQRLLMAARKYNNRSGLFSTDTSRIQAMQAATYELGNALVDDNATSHPVKADSIIEFMCLFSMAYPNWQGEYELLSDFIRRIYTR
jgi:hypothetical protein